MHIRKARGYDAFRCIADKCPATCCAGWLIEIDEGSLDRYRQEKSDYGNYLRDSIDWNETVFRQDASGRCAFLQESGLCDMYSHLGEESLCLTCRTYPRHQEEFENVREYSLAVSCPEAARSLLSMKEKMTWEEWEEEETEETYEEFQGFLYERLLEMRYRMLGILQDRKVPFSVRCRYVLDDVYAMQQALDEGRWETCLDTLPHKAEWDSGMAAFSDRKEMRRLYQDLYRLEPLQPEWRQWLFEAEKVLYDRSDDDYRRTLQAFEEALPDLEIQLEQVVVYYVFGYFCGAVYDEYVYGLAQEAVVNGYLIRDLWMAEWLRQERNISLEDQVRILYGYSRELEHSNENLIAMEEMMDAQILVE